MTMAEVQTVNIVQMDKDYLLGVRSFEDNPSGNEQAEAVFSECAQKKGCLAEEVSGMIADGGYYETKEYQLFLTHSSFA
jgi:hypothetical protein